jgi:hypothetical protein
MKKFLRSFSITLALGAAVLWLFAGCTTRTVKIGSATYSSKHFLTKQTFGEITLHTGTNSLTIRQWSNDGISAAALITEAAVKAAVSAAK